MNEGWELSPNPTTVGPQGVPGTDGVDGAGYRATSATSLAVATGSKTFTTQSGLAYTVGARARASSLAAPGSFMEGLVTAYAANSLTILVDLVGTAGTNADWDINLAGERGVPGANGTNGTNGAGYLATSATSLSIATGSKAFTTQAGLAYTAGARARASSAAAPTVDYMEGVVTAYSSTTLTILVDNAKGSGTHADWDINLAGDVGQDGNIMDVAEEPPGVVVTAPTRLQFVVADGFTVTDEGGGVAQVGFASSGGSFNPAIGGYVVVDSTSQLSLVPYKGNTVPLKISGTWGNLTIPASGVQVSNTGLTQATLYYLYAFANSGAIGLEFSTTGRTVDADTGVEIKSGDATRTLLAMVFMDTGTPGLFVNSATKRWCLNWFVRKDLDVQGTISANRSMTGFSFVEPNAEIRTPFLTWADEAVSAAISGSLRNNHSTAEIEALMGVAFDGTTPEACCGMTVGSGGVEEPADHMPFSVHVWKTLSEGSHYATMVGAFEDNSAGLMTVFTADTASSARAKAWVRVMVRG